MLYVCVLCVFVCMISCGRDLEDSGRGETPSTVREKWIESRFAREHFNFYQKERRESRGDDAHLPTPNLSYYKHTIPTHTHNNERISLPISHKTTHNNNIYTNHAYRSWTGTRASSVPPPYSPPSDPRGGNRRRVHNRK